MFDFLVGLGTLVSLGFFIPNRWDGDESFTFCLVALVSVLSWIVPQKRKISFIPLGIFLVTILIDFVFHAQQKQVLSNILLGAVAMKLIAERSNFSFEALGRLLIFYAVICDVVIALQLFGADPIWLKYFHEASGATVMPWIMGTIAVLSIPFVCKVNPVACFFMIPMLWFSHSLTCVAVAVVTFFLPSVKKNTAFLLAILAALLFMIFSGKTINPSRFMVWKGSLQYLHTVWNGNGIGMWAHEGFLRMNGATPEYWRWAHNEYFQMFFEGGVLVSAGLIAFVLGLLRARNSTAMDSICGICLLSLFHPIFHSGNLLMLLILIFAIIFKEESWTKTA